MARNHRKKWIVSFVLGIVVSAGFLFFLLQGDHSKSGKSLTEIWRQMYWQPAVWATLLYLLGHFLRGVRCSWILHPYHRLSHWHATQIVWIGYAANNVLPARLGELVRAYVLTRREDVAYGISLSTLLIERILDGLAIVGILCAVAWFAPAHPFIEKLAWGAGILFVGALGVVLLARLWQPLFARIMTAVCLRLPSPISAKAESFGLRLLDGTQCLQWDRRLPGILGMSILIWLVEGGMFLVMLSAFGLPMSWTAAYLAMTVTNLGVLVPSTPSNMGTFHFFCTKGLLLSGVIATSTMGLGYAIAVHLLQVIPVTFLGLGCLYAYGLNLKTVWAGKPEESTESPVRKSTAESAAVLAVRTAD